MPALLVAASAAMAEYFQYSPAASTGGSGVTSFNTRTGAVTPESGDYSSFYLPLAGGTMSGNINMGTDSITNAHGVSSVLMTTEQINDDSGPALAVDIDNRILEAQSGVDVSVDWQNGLLHDFVNGSNSVNWMSHQLYSQANYVTLDFSGVANTSNYLTSLDGGSGMGWDVISPYNYAAEGFDMAGDSVKLATGTYGIDEVGGSHYLSNSGNYETWISYDAATSAVFAQTNSGSGFQAALASDLNGAALYAQDNTDHEILGPNQTSALTASTTPSITALLGTSSDYINGQPAAASFTDSNSDFVTIDGTSTGTNITAIAGGGTVGAWFSSDFSNTYWAQLSYNNSITPAAGKFTDQVNTVLLTDGTHAVNITGQQLWNPMAQPSGTTAGQVYFDSGTNTPYYFDGASWQAMSGSGPSLWSYQSSSPAGIYNAGFGAGELLFLGSNSDDSTGSLLQAHSYGFGQVAGNFVTPNGGSGYTAQMGGNSAANFSDNGYASGNTVVIADGTLALTVNGSSTFTDPAGNLVGIGTGSTALQINAVAGQAAVFAGDAAANGVGFADGTYAINISAGDINLADQAIAPSTSIGTPTNYYGTSATNYLGTPSAWAVIYLAGTAYKMPLYQ